MHFTQDSIASDDRFEIIMEEFSPICQRYTDVMAHKYYLQHLLLNKTIASAVTVNLTSVIVKLQAVGYSLENVRVRMSCILKLASYYNIFTKHNLFTD